MEGDGMNKKRLLTLGAAAVATLVLGSIPASSSDTPTLDTLKFTQAVFAAVPEPLDNHLDPPGFFQVKPQEFDPGRTDLVQASSLNAIGCPTDAFIAIPNADFTGVAGTAPFTDPACVVGDPKDEHNEGLLLVKTGPTTNFASATAELTKVKGITLTELGYDIRKAGASGASPLGSHCGAGAPRFNVVTADGMTHFLGCNSPPGVVESFSNGWIRQRWNAAALLGAFPPITPGQADPDHLRRGSGRRPRLFRRRDPRQHRRERRARRARRHRRRLGRTVSTSTRRPALPAAFASSL
jgi:hypothetical protein